MLVVVGLFSCGGRSEALADASLARDFDVDRLGLGDHAFGFEEQGVAPGLQSLEAKLPSAVGGGACGLCTGLLGVTVRQGNLCPSEWCAVLIADISDDRAGVLLRE